MVHNGEIYNYRSLRANELKEYAFQTECDSEVIIFLYEKYHTSAVCNMLDGVFAFAMIYDDEFLAARDPIGVKPMYYGVDLEGRYYFRYGLDFGS